MPDYINALVVVLGLALPVLVLSKQPLCLAGYDESSFKRHRTMWILVTLSAFLGQNYWLYITLCFAVTLLAAPKERTPLALYLMVLFAAPHFTVYMRGFGPIQNLFAMNHIRLLNLTILTPLAIALFRRNKGDKPALQAPDMAVILFLMLIMIKQIFNESVTMIMREAFYSMLDIWIPYYVASRSLNKLSEFRELASALVVATVIMSLIAVFESVKGWLLYDSLRSPFGIPMEFTSYTTREVGGALRAIASTTYPIILGYVLMIGLGMFAYLSPSLKPVWKARAAGLFLLAGLIAALSRGPWVGAVAMAMVMLVMGPDKSKRLTMVIGVGGPVAIGILMSPVGDTLIAYLPFVGNVAEENVDYRFRLLEVGMTVLMQNPIFGDLHFMSNPYLEEMRQGQGIIDIVNSYLQVALRYGLLGLGLFLAALLLPLRSVWRTRKRLLEPDPEAERLGRALLATMIGILVTIATASSIGVIPSMYWLMAGICVSYSRALEPEIDRVGAVYNFGPLAHFSKSLNR